jgi:hypothetical protein
MTALLEHVCSAAGAELRVSLAVSAVLALGAAVTWFDSSLTQQKEKIPDFSLDNKFGLAHDQRRFASARERSWPGDF